MTVKISDKLKVWFEAGIMQHAPGIAADREYFACFYFMMAIEIENLRQVLNGAFINNRLTIFFAMAF